MAFSLDQFYRLNRRALIWVILGFVLWLLRDFFGVIFLTFLLTFFAVPMIRFAEQRMRLPRRLTSILIYGFFLLLFVGFVRFITFSVINEVNRLLRDLRQIEKTVVDVKEDLVEDYPSINAFMNGYIRSMLPEETLRDSLLPRFDDDLARMRAELDATAVLLGGQSPQAVIASEDAPTTQAQAANLYLINERGLHQLERQQSELLGRLFLGVQARQLRERVPEAIELLWQALASLLFALLFSFLITLDFGRLGRELRSLRSSKLHDFYEEAAQPVVRFCFVLGRAFQAQAVIALVNTALTVIGLTVLQVPSMAMLSLIVFICSFIPVLGVIISTIPMLLVAINAGGLHLALAVVVMVVVIHALEAYVLNPMIYGHHMKLNPVLVLMILFIGHHTFGLWGMLLGVPVTYYFLHDVFGVPVWSDHRQLPSGRTVPAGEEAARVAGVEPRPARGEPGPGPE